MDPVLNQKFVTRYNFKSDLSKAGRLLESVKVGEVYISRLEIEPRVVTGNLYHKEMNTIMFVERGKIKFKLMQINTKEEKEMIMSPGDGILHIPPYVVIATKNISQEPGVMIFFSDKPLRSGDDWDYKIME